MSQDQSVASAVRAGIRRGLGSGKGPDRAARKVTNRRMRATAVVVMVLAAILGLRLVYLQVVQASTLAETAREFRWRTYPLEAKRGDIVDANGAVLATSLERYNVRADQTEIADFVTRDDEGNITGAGAAAAAKILAPLLKADPAELGGLLLGGETKSKWQLIASDISPEEWREINALGIRGIYPERFMQRQYPNGTTAGTVVGYLGQTEESDTPSGRAGIEQQYDTLLSGTPGMLQYEVAAGGAVFPNSERRETPAVDGGSVHLTIDADLQKATEDALNKVVAEQRAEWGTAVVIEVGTGRVLALADSNSPDPANLSASDPADWNSRAVSAVVEPGSTGKVVTYSAAINEGTITPLDLFLVSTPMQMPNGEVIRDNDDHPAERLTVAGTLAKSYNTGLIQIGDTLEDAVRYRYMTDFGLGSRTGIELPGESGGVVYPYEDWGGRTHYTTMFGQAWSATTLQLGQMMSVIANKGVYIPLHIVDGVQSVDGEYTATAVGESRQVITEESAHTMLDMMQAVTDPYSTGWLAREEGYNVAGKTGTAQVPDATGALTKRAGTFVGTIPAEDPKIIFASIVYNAAGAGYGGDTAAAVFSGTAQFAMRQMKVAPSQVPLVRLPWTEAELNQSKQ
ncbi:MULTISPECIES: peptidoglycan D,D-transpeptidase FtsI family protein [Trueperella]|uniref:Cell division protein FtsI (Penicillin-binding protein 3) n=1 Tax=Trueperella abortisuis TaxID=445930 RepID=A0ABT9PI83_9ACTO|nr:MULTISPECIES: penicillin-binding protein 2 [Trueperella]MCI7305632.1 penicillin-binding protein 2 [Trueperella sp.]MDP9832201.1 cell division protein FtsI (penicillin-binding protein 3) [Trueperella abortisuis]MDY5403015.1 penicillin-binding protein 2 [Trueperella sp.]